MNETSPRFEFRSFRTCFDDVERRLRSMSECESITESTEVYILAPAHIHDRNLKVRDGRLEIKRLLERDRGLERWEPAGQWDFPIPAESLDEILPEGGGAGWGGNSAQALTEHDLVELALRPEIPLFRARVFKRRFRFAMASCRAEIDQLVVHGATIQSAAMEAEDPDALLVLRSVLQLDAQENMAYPLLLSRVMGMTRLPDEDDYG
jgi:hypothetical protein